ncbi:hypothetical protein [Catenuloplanes atrovinosus]|uniref:Uncharacterized protein n=1 Tax=Catenuloplanes atrovinosus TaxID=137266 RepID=A0AAE4C9Q5_9ACTN|nr:hypothetical protein [Catenuloplanes atrovinosus]MDR7276313.1 hypothetical protein [Catenuloplanes atrovinosus]
MVMLVSAVLGVAMTACTAPADHEPAAAPDATVSAVPATAGASPAPSASGTPLTLEDIERMFPGQTGPGNIVMGGRGTEPSRPMTEEEMAAALERYARDTRRNDSDAGDAESPDPGLSPSVATSPDR